MIGPFAIEADDGMDITPRGKRAKALIALLCTSNNASRTRAWIQEKLWSDRGTIQASASLRQELSELRKHFEASGIDFLTIDRDTVRINLASISIDIRNPTDDTTSHEFLEGFDLGDPAFEDWLRDERQAWIAACERRANGLAVVAHTTNPTSGISLATARPSIGLVLDHPTDAAPTAIALGDMFLDVLARSFQSFDVVDLIDLRIRLAPPPPRDTPSGPDWILQAKVRPIGHAVCMSIHLMAIEDRRILWSQTRCIDAEAYCPGDPTGLGSLVNEVTFATLDQILKSQRPNNQARHEAARLAIGALYQMFQLQDADLDAAERMLVRAYELEPKSSYLGWLLFISTTRLGERRVGRSDPFHDQVRDYARRAIENDPFNPITLALTAHAYSFVFREYEYALDLADRAVSASPLLAIGRDMRALTLGYLGDVERGYQDALLARQLGGPPPYRYLIDTTCCILSTLSGRFEEGIRHGRRVLSQQPRYLPALRYTASCQGHLGLGNDAQLTLERLRREEPDFSVEVLRSPDYPIAGVLGASVIEQGLARLRSPA